MEYTLADFKKHYAAKRGFESWDRLTATLKVAGLNQINQLLDLIWNWKGGWGFNGDKFQLSLISPLANTVTGTAGERVVTLGTAVNASYNGISLVGQYINIGDRMYRLNYRRSSTVYAIDAPLIASYSGATCSIYFTRYPVPYGIGAIRHVVRNQDTIEYIPEVLLPTDNIGGLSDFAYNAGRLQADLLNSGTVNVTANSDQVVYSGTVSVDHIGTNMLIKKSEAYQYFRIIDVNTTGGGGTNYFVIDRPYTGSTETGLSFALNPAGTQMIGFKPYPLVAELVEVAYTKACNKLINDSDVTGLPDNTPMMVGIEVLGTKWETVGERGFINEVLFQDKKFIQSLKVLNLRGTPLQNRLYSMRDNLSQNRFPRNTNPWNSR